jgi:hypothetical protein
MVNDGEIKSNNTSINILEVIIPALIQKLAKEVIGEANRFPSRVINAESGQHLNPHHDPGTGLKIHS